MELLANISTEPSASIFTTVSSTTVDPSFILFYLPLPMSPILKYLIISLCLLGFICGSFGNVLVIFAIARNKKLRIVANSFLASLAVADFGTSSIVFPLLAIGFGSLETIISSPFLCRLFYFSSLTFASVSIQHLILIAGSRYVLVTKSRQTFNKIFNKVTVTAKISLVWIFNLLLNLTVSITSYGTERFHGKDYCFFEENNLLGNFYKAFTLVITFLSCFVVIPVLYVTTFRTVRKSRVRVMEHNNISVNNHANSMPGAAVLGSISLSIVRQINETARSQVLSRLSSQEIRLIKVNFIIFITNVCFLSPLIFFLLVRGRQVIHGELFLILFFVAMNSVVNPLVYCGFNKNFRQVFKQLLRL